MNRSALPFLLVIAGCSHTAMVGGQNIEAPACNANKIQALVGQPATQEVAVEAQRVSGARVVRWLRPNMAVTMEFRADRLNITLDDRNLIERITCG